MTGLVTDMRKMEKEKEANQEQELKKNSGFFPKLLWILLTLGTLLFMITAIQWIATLRYPDMSAYLFWVLTSLLILLHVIIGLANPPESYSLEIILDGNQICHMVPLRHVLIVSANTVVGIAGVVSMAYIGLRRPCYGTLSAWNIFGFILSILLLLWVIISSLGDKFLKQKSPMELPHIQFPEEVVKKSEEFCAGHLETLVNLFYTLLPLPSMSSLTSSLKQSRTIINKPVHILSVFLAMILCLLMFSAQLWFIKSRPYVEEWQNADQDDYFAREWDITGTARVVDRKLVILISTPVTFILSILLIILVRKTTVISMLVVSLISSFLGVFFLVFSFFSVQYIILMGVNFSLLHKILTLITLLPVPLLSSIFLALAYSNILQLQEEKEAEKMSNSESCCLTFSMFLSVAFIFLSISTMININLAINNYMKDDWSTTIDHKYDMECKGLVYVQDSYGEYYPEYYEKPAKCHGKVLEISLQERCTFFSISQMSVTESMIFYFLLLVLTGRRITRKALFLPGILLFVSAGTTFKTFITGFDQNYSHYKNNNLFLLILGYILTIVSFIIGLSCSIIGSPVLITFIVYLSRTIWAMIVLIFIFFITLAQSFLMLAGSLARMISTTIKNSQQRGDEEC